LRRRAVVRLFLAGSSAALLSLDNGAAMADDPPPTISLSVRDTLDLWDNTTGGLRQGTALLNKLQLGGTFDASRSGVQGLSFHVQMLRLDGNSLSAKVGDIQTVDSIDTRPVTRLFESWVEQKFGDDDRSLAFRFGLMDLNADFDSIQTASLFTNSSQGIGADLARSGRNGPSIYPVSSLGLRISWLPNKKWTFRIAALDGVPGDPAHPGAFASVKLSASDGALVIGQVDYHLSDKAKIEAGAWRYSTLLPDVGDARRLRPDQGAYVSIEGPIPGLDKWSAWGRAGIANGNAQAVSGYFGAGLVGQGLIAARPEDRIGLAIARAAIGDPARRAFGLPAAETSIELSYQAKIHDTFALQPDLQYIVHPAAAANIPNALVLGLRLVVTAGYPKKAPANEATDPTVPPDGPQPTDDQTKPPAGSTSG
jgi:porin